MRLMRSVLLGAASTAILTLVLDVAAAQGTATPTGNVTTYASGLTNPRGLAFGPDGTLYVALAGTGGDVSTTADQCVQVEPPIGPYTGGGTAGIASVDAQGTVTMVASGLPSSVNAMQDYLGVSAVAFVGDTLYALIAGGGCSHGHADMPSGVVRIGSDGSATLTADLSAFWQANPVAQPNQPDFEPDGTAYSMVAYQGDLYVVEPNHGEVDKVALDGQVTRVVDISAHAGHIVPTSIAVSRDSFLVGNLGVFPIVPKKDGILRVTLDGQVSAVASDLTTVLGVVADGNGTIYVLESSNAEGMPQPGAGDIVRISSSGEHTVIASGLTTPTAMVMGPDGALYVSAQGYGAPPGSGAILRVELPM
ncbi:MAG: ScyD/ScyE family protein [Deinococcales bacterium]|jgi:glucose/arabinose dehydrogenase